MPFLIDGHNLIGQTPGLRLDDPDDEQKLVELLRGYLARIKKKGYVIFDRGLPGGASKWSNSILEVRFAPLPKTADQVIIERLRKEKNPRGLTVVSGDNDVIRAARQAGAAVKSPAAFAQDMLARPALPDEKEKGLSANEVEAWEEEFKQRRGSDS
jgi:predicted RNA-binding protein with PIN domain